MRTTWDDLLRPGEANNFFNPPPEATPFRAEVRAYDPVNAWWLMELSRLVYSHEKVARAAFLLRARLEEIAFFDEPSTETQAFLVAPPSREWAALVFRGTENLKDWLLNAQFGMAPWEGGGRAHAGFQRAFLSVRDRISEALQANVPNAALFYTGHSLGASLATLAAAWRKPAATYTFGSPYVGDATFGRSLDLEHLFRVVNDRDVVATVPPPIPPKLDYVHFGALHKIGESHDALDILSHPVFAPVLPELHSISLDAFHKKFEQWGQGFLSLVDPPEPLADHAPINYVNLLGALAGIPPRVPRLLSPPSK